MKRISIDKIWGVGKQTSNWLQSKGIKNARELRDMEENEIIKKLGIIGKRLQLELKGYKCLPIEKNKQSQTNEQQASNQQASKDSSTVDQEPGTTDSQA